MPEPDFTAIAAARIIVMNQGHLATVAEQLRLVWNTRGAADVSQLGSEQGQLLNLIAESIRSLDR